MKPRLWPAVLIIAAGASSLAWTWWREDAIRQQRMLATLVTLALVALALTIWLVLLSPLPRRARRLGGLAIAVPALLAPIVFRIHGVTGDLVPILEPRWRGRAPDRTPWSSQARPADQGEGGSYPQFQGPARDASLTNPRLARDWTDRAPRQLWRQRVGEAWSGFAVAQGLAVTQEQHGAEERVTAYEASSGRLIWSHADAARYETVIAGVGPRATPTISGGRVYTMGATGLLNAFELSTGRRLWARDVVRENQAVAPEWGKSGSPLLVDGRVIVSAGGTAGRSLVAYDAADGSPVWAAGSDRSSYSSPTLLTMAGRRQVVMLSHGSVAGHDPATGRVLWEQPFPTGQPHVAVPLPLPGDRLLVSVGYGVGSKAYRLAKADEGLAVTLEWESPRLKSKFANLVWHDGSVYGLDDGVLTCIDPATGERRWKGGRYGHGQLLLVAGLLLVQTEDGEIALVEPRPDEHRELARFPALEGKTWNPPALAGRVLFVRNEREAAAYELPTENPVAAGRPSTVDRRR